MSSSYPAPTGHLETRTFLKTLAHGKKETEIVLSDKMETVNDKDKDSNSGNFIHQIYQYFCPLVSHNETKSEDIDDVDGRAEDLLRPLVKLVFLKILLVDIGISLGDVVTDFLQGISLVFDSDWNIQWNTYHYGVAILVVMWIPAIVAILHF